MAERLRDVTDASQIADLSGYSPDLSLAQKVEVLETVDLEARLRLVLGWARETLADLTLREQIKTNVEEGMEKTQREFLLRRQLEAIRKELNELDGTTDEGSVDDYRAKVGERDLPERCARAVLREVDKLERTSEQSPEHGWIRTWLDTVFELPWGVQSEDNLDVDAAAGDPRRGPRRAEGREGAHPRAPGGAQAARRSRPRVHGAARLGCHPGPGRAPRRGQDIARGVGGARPGTQVRARRPGRRARRGRDPRPPPHLCGRPARPPGAGAARGGDDEPRHRAGRGGQARCRLPG